MSKNEIKAWTWREEEYTAHGEGLTRARAKARTREYHLIIYMLHGQPMQWIVRAESLRHAIRYAKARWPGTTVEQF